MDNVFSSNADFLPQFKAIGQSLKRRFFRKPNVWDAVHAYDVLCQELQREQPEFAAICCLEAARCQETLQNPIPQANLLVKAAKLFLRAYNSYKYFEKADDEVHLKHASYGHYQMAIQCLSQAAKIYKTQKYYGLCLVVNMQIGAALYNENSYGEALKYFKAALDISKTNFSLADTLVTFEQVLKCKVKLLEYDGVSKNVNDMISTLSKSRQEVPPELYKLFMQRFEIMRVCLILILGVNTVDLVKFIWPEGLQQQVPSGEENDERRMLLLHLKSLVLAVQHGSTNEIKDVRNNLAFLLNETQQDLFNTLIQMQS